MKRWAALTVLLYLVILALLTLPMLLIGFGNWGLPKDPGISPKEALTVFSEWGYWAWLIVMAVGQAFLLFAPVSSRGVRLTPRRPLFIPILTSAFFLATLALAGLISFLCLIWREKGMDAFAVIGEVVGNDPAHGFVANKLFKSPGLVGPGGLNYVTGIIAVMALFWLVWGMIFYAFARSDNPETVVKRTTRWLLRGSVLELLVAVPSHIVARNRGDCCAPLGTFWGITMGISVMLLCFGPGVYFLFTERFERLRPKSGGMGGPTLQHPSALPTQL